MTDSQLREDSTTAVPVAPGDPESTGLDEVVRAALRPIALGLALLYAVFAVAHTLVLSPSVAAIMTLLAAGSALGLGGLFVVLGRREVPARWAHPLATAMAFVVLANSLAHLYLTGDPLQTTNLVLLVLGVGIVMLDPAWFALVVVGSFAGFLFTARVGPPSVGWAHFGFFLLAATVLATTVLLLRVRAFRRMKELQRRGRVRELELEAALDRTEAARHAEEEARRALETAVSQLKESEERFRRLADASFEGVAIHDEGTILDANRTLADLFDTSLSSLIGRHLSSLFTPESRERVRAMAGTPAHAESGTQATGLRSDGSRFPVEISMTGPARQGDAATVTVVRDVSAWKRAEEKLTRAAEEARASDRAKTLFLANMSHELRTPLNAVIGFTGVLRKNGEGRLSEKELEDLERVRVNAEHLLELIDDVLDLSRIEAGRMELGSEEVELPEVVREALDSVEAAAERKGLRLESELPEPLDTVRADPRRLRQVLMNLLSNAIKFTASGSVTVRIVTTTDGIPRRVEVEDTGIGIPEGHLSRIFHPFRKIDASTSMRLGGTGLGLTLSRSLCRLMGFDLRVRSMEGVGSTFTVDFTPDSALLADPRLPELRRPAGAGGHG